LSFSARRLNERPTSTEPGDTYNRLNARAVATAKPSRLLGAPEPPQHRRAKRHRPRRSPSARRHCESLGANRSSEHERRGRTCWRRPQASERIEVEQFRRPARRSLEGIERVRLGWLQGTFRRRSERFHVEPIIERLLSNRPSIGAPHPEPDRRPVSIPGAAPTRRTTRPRSPTPTDTGHRLGRHHIKATSPIRPRHLRRRKPTPHQSQAVGQRGPARRARRHPHA
jgi:hypothetical protein